MKTIDFTDQFVARLSKESDSVELLDQKGSGDLPRSILVKMEAVHSHVNANFVLYPPEKLRGDADFQVNGLRMPTGMHSFTDPYPKPVLINHDHDDVKATVGRVERAYFSEKTAPELPGGIIEARITDPDAIKAVLDGRFFTVSVGLTSDAAYCSICGANWVDEPCGHFRGQEYDGKLAYWTSGNIWFKEVSFVNIPADRFAKVVGISMDNATSASASNNSTMPSYLMFSDNPILLPSRVVTLVSEIGEKKEVTSLKNSESPNPETQENKNEAALSDTHSHAITLSDSGIGAIRGNIQLKDAEDEGPQKLDVFLDEYLGPIRAELDDAQGRIHELEATVAELKDKLTALEAKDNEPKEQSKVEPIEQELKDALSERVADLRIALGKVSESDREQAVALYRKKSLEYLTDALADLTRELATSPMYRTVVHRPMVSPPGLAINHKEKNVINVDSSEGSLQASHSKLPDKYARLYKKDQEL